MDKEEIETDPENCEEEKSPLTDNEDEQAETSEVESEEQEKTLEELKEENKDLSDKMMRALAETENIRKKFFKEC